MVSDVAVRGYLKNLVGDDGLEMIERASINELTDEKIAEETGSNLNTVRRTLYILYENRLANYRRERDKDSGWLTYLWKVDLSDISRNMDEEAQKLIRKLDTRLDFEGKSVVTLAKTAAVDFYLRQQATMILSAPFAMRDLIIKIALFWSTP